MLLSLSNRDYTYIEKAKDIVNNIDAHNAGNRSNETRQQALYIYVIFAFICEFTGYNHLMYKWKETRDNSISQGIHDPREFARRGNEVINVRHSFFLFTNVSNELRLVLLFRRIKI